MESNRFASALTELSGQGFSVLSADIAAGVIVFEPAGKFEMSSQIGYAFRRDVVCRGATLLSPNDPFFQFQWGLDRIGVQSAWDTELGRSSVVVAVLDTGIDYNHPDLAPRVWANAAETTGAPGVDDDGNGYVDDLRGWDFWNNDNDPIDDMFPNYHGTHVSGIVAAGTNNGVGVAGTAQVSIMPLKVISWDDLTSPATIAAAVNYARLMQADIISMSLRLPGFDPSVDAALQAAWNTGVVAFAASGNFNQPSVSYPASSAFVVAVGATNQADQRCSPSDWGTGFGSNYGADLEIMAPGNFVMSTILSTSGSGYLNLSGTSQATPFVSGLAGLMLSRSPGLSRAELLRILFSTSRDLGTAGRDDLYGHGRIEASAAIRGDAGSGRDSDTFAGAVPITSGSHTSHLSSADTEDWFKFTAESGVPLEVLMTPPQGTDFQLSVYDPLGNYEAGSAQSGDATERVAFTTDASGEWRIRVYLASGNGRRYQLALNLGPAAPQISSFTHPNPNSWYPSHDPCIEWTVPPDPSGIAGYSYVLDHSSTTIPGTSLLTSGTSKCYTGLTDGEWYFHVRAKNGNGQWGATGHFRIRIASSVPQNDAGSGRDAGRDRSGAVGVVPGTHTGMLDSASDDTADYYTYWADAGQYVDVTLASTEGKNLDLYLHGPNEQSKASSARTGATPEHASYVVDQSGYQGIRIISPNSVDDGAYVFTLSVGGSPPTAVSLQPPGSVTKDSVILSWSANSDVDFAKYEIHVSTTNSFVPTYLTRYTSITDRSTTSSAVGGLSSGVTYYFVVRVVDSEGLFADSNQVSATTLEDRPTVVIWERTGLSSPFSAQRLGNNTLVAEASGPRVVEFLPDGSIAWQYGGSCGAGFNQLCVPRDAKRLGGNTLITDTANHRVIEVDSSNNIVWQYGTTGVQGNGFNQLATPGEAERLPNNNVLIADTGNNRVIEVDRNRNVMWSYSNNPNPPCIGPSYCFQPWDAERLPNDNILITEDQHQVREVTRGYTIVWSYGIAGDSSGGLSFPHGATRLPNGDTLIADSNARRVVQVDSFGSIVWSYATGLSYPVDVSRLQNGNTLIADWTGGRVLEIGPAPYPTPSVMDPPSQVTNVSMTLTWSRNSDASFARYEVYRSLTDGFVPSPLERIAAITDSATTTWADSGLEDSTTYYFRLRTVNIWNLHADSNQASATTLPNPPDLVPTDLMFLPGNPATNNTQVTLRATLANVGGTATPPFVVRFYRGDPDAGGTQIGGDVSVAPLAGRASTVASATWTPTAVGIHNLFVVADATGQVAEMVETNNKAFATLIVMSEPDLVPVSMSATPAAGANEGDMVTIFGAIANGGETAANGLIASAWWGDPFAGGVLIATSPPFDVPAGSTVEVTLSWTASRTGSPGLFLFADPDNAFSEIDENNNVIGLSYMINALPLVPLLDRPADGEQVGTATPTLTWSAVDPEGSFLQYVAELSRDGFQTVLRTYDQRSDPLAWPSPWFASGAPASFTIPTADALLVGQTYAWRVRAWDGSALGPLSASRTFSVESDPPLLRPIFPVPDGFVNTYQPVILVTVTDAIAGVDDTTLELVVDGQSYRLGDSGMFWDGTTLAFDTAYAGIGFTDGQAVSLEVFATDALGNAGSVRWIFHVDLSPPVSQAFVSGTLGANGWYTTPVTISITATDAGSGVASVANRIDAGPWQTYVTPIGLGDGSHLVEYFATDSVGNAESPSSLVVAVDTSAPLAQATVTGTTGRAGWYTSPATVSLTGADGGSGVDEIRFRINGGSWQGYTAPFVAGEGLHSIEFYAVDKAGNAGAWESLLVPVDTEAPTSSISVAGVQGAAGWHTSPVTVAFTAVDSTSGVDTIEYQIDGSSWTQYAAPVSVTGDGVYTLTFRAMDFAGNVEATQSSEIRIDGTQPSLELSEPPGGWTKETTVAVRWSGSDATSGIERYEVVVDSGPPEATTSTEKVLAGLADGTHTVVVRAYDVAGNLHEVIGAFSVDATPPSVYIDSPAAGSQSTNSAVMVSWTRADGGSDVKECSVAVDGQTPRPVGNATEFELRDLADGVHGIRVACEDLAGNRGEATTAFEVETQPPIVSDPLVPALLAALAGTWAVLFILAYWIWRNRRRSHDEASQEPPRPPDRVD